jgi:hypothetical protein
LEGTVILDIVAGEDGAVRDIKIVEGLAEALSDAAVLGGLHADYRRAA